MWLLQGFLQAVELATLIPLRLGCRRLILVGDPKQLPATIFSRVAIQLVSEPHRKTLVVACLIRVSSGLCHGRTELT